jgi:hypothetical protein
MGFDREGDTCLGSFITEPRRSKPANELTQIQMLQLTSLGFVASSSLPLAKIVTVTKNEYDLIEDFIRYYGSIFGYENVIILDNESDNPIVLDVYRRYSPKGVTVRTVVGYSGSSQGDHFTNAMREQTGSAEFLIGVDTDCFFTVNGHCDKYTIHTYLRSLPRDRDIFRVNAFLMSVVDPTTENYADHKLIRPTNCTTFVARNGYAGMSSIQHVFFRAQSFVHTANGNHSGTTTTNRGHSCPEVAYVHYHDTGKRRHLERCKAILVAYGYIRNEMTESEQLKSLCSNSDGSGFHRKRQYIEYLQRPDTFFQEDPLPSDTFEYTEVKRAIEHI